MSLFNLEHSDSAPLLCHVIDLLKNLAEFSCSVSAFQPCLSPGVVCSPCFCSIRASVGFMPNLATRMLPEWCCVCPVAWLRSPVGGDVVTALTLSQTVPVSCSLTGFIILSSPKSSTSY